MITKEQAQVLLTDGGIVVSEDGREVGDVRHVFLDDRSGNPEWVTATAGASGGVERFIPLAGGVVEGRSIRVPYSQDDIKDAPRLDDVDDHLSHDQEAELYRYYGLSYSEGDPESDASEAPGDRGDEYDDEGDEHDADEDLTDRRVERNSGLTDRSLTEREDGEDAATEQAAGTIWLRKVTVTETVTEIVTETTADDDEDDHDEQNDLRSR